MWPKISTFQQTEKQNGVEGQNELFSYTTYLVCPRTVARRQVSEAQSWIPPKNHTASEAIKNDSQIHFQIFYFPSQNRNYFGAQFDLQLQLHENDFRAEFDLHLKLI